MCRQTELFLDLLLTNYLGNQGFVLKVDPRPHCSENSEGYSLYLRRNHNGIQSGTCIIKPRAELTLSIMNRIREEGHEFDETRFHYYTAITHNIPIDEVVSFLNENGLNETDYILMSNIPMGTINRQGNARNFNLFLY